MPAFDELIQEIDKEIRNEPHGHSEFQIKNFIIGSQPTKYGQYKQCVLELRSRIKNYNVLNERYSKMKSREDLSLDEIKQVSEYEILLEDLKRETYIISDLYNEIKKDIDLNRRDELEIEFWDVKFGKEVTDHQIAGCPLPVTLVQSILSLPNECRSKRMIIQHLNKGLENGPKRSITDKSK